jgi:hypothetical protein
MSDDEPEMQIRKSILDTQKNKYKDSGCRAEFDVRVILPNGNITRGTYVIEIFK